MALSRWALTAGLAMFAAAPLRAQPADATRIINESRDSLRETLTSPTTTAAQKEEAARRLIERQVPGTRLIFLPILSNPGNRDAKVAVGKAVAADPSPDPVLIRPLAGMLGADRDATKAAASAAGKLSEQWRCPESAAGLCPGSPPTRCGTGGGDKGIRKCHVSVDRGRID